MTSEVLFTSVPSSSSISVDGVHRTQHVHGERRPAQPLARAQRQDRRPVRLGDLAHVREGPAGERHRADGERPDGTPGQLRPVCCRHSLLV
jgi:hypothetical protein